MFWYDGYFMIDTGNAKSLKKLRRRKNAEVFGMVAMRLMNVYLDTIKLEGLPETCSERLIKQSLMTYANVTFFKERGALLALPSIPGGNGWNVNGDPVSVHVYSMNGQVNKEVPLFIPGGIDNKFLEVGNNGLKEDPRGVCVWDNQMRYPAMHMIIFYAEAIADTLRTIDVCRKWLKTPNIFVAEQSLVQDIRNAIKTMEENEEIMVLSSGIQTVDKLDLKPTGDVPGNVQKAIELAEWYENQFRERIGFKANTASDKKGENLITDEIHINDNYVDSTLGNRVEYIQKGIDMVNDIFGTNITVKENIKSEGSEQASPEDKEATNGKE